MNPVIAPVTVDLSDPQITVRPPASIVVLAWNAWPVTQECLTNLRATLGLRDEVIVVDNGSGDDTPVELAQRRWAKVLTNPVNRGFSGGNNDGAAIASGEILVFLNNDTVPVGAWLDRLLAPFADPSVVATGPRSNFASGPQMVEDTSYMSDRIGGLKAFVHHWEREHQREWQPLNRLVGFCLAVRRSAFEAIGGFDEAFEIGGYEDDDLCRRLAEHGRLLMVNDAYVHHHGHVSFDANGLDWAAIELRNRETFLAKHAPAPAPEPADAGFAPIASVLVDQRAPSDVDAAFTSAGVLVVRASLDGGVLDALDRVEVRPEMVVALADTLDVMRCDLPLVVVADEPVALGDLVVTRDEPAREWVPQALEAIATVPLYGSALLQARRALDGGDLSGGIDAALAAEDLRPETAQVANLLGICALIAGQVDDSLAFFRRALALDPGYPYARVNAEQLGAD